MYQLITILGPTATGKTTLASHLALQINAEIISADSRQVYRGMTIGTGKDLKDYTVNTIPIPYHLIDTQLAGAEYNIYNFQHDFHAVYTDITARNKNTILCGGSGMYIESVLRGYNLPGTPNNEELRNELETKSDEELIALLAEKETLHNTTDIKERSRLIHAIELAIEKEKSTPKFAPVNSILFGIDFDREIIRNRITKRLHERLEEGMIEEIKTLIEQGVSTAQLKKYGLEYKYLTLFLEGTLSYNEMVTQLNTAIHRFAKRQMTWFRRMERNGLPIHWVNGELGINEKVERIIAIIKK